MDDIVSKDSFAAVESSIRNPPDDKKRQSGEYTDNVDPNATTSATATPPQRSASFKKHLTLSPREDRDPSKKPSSPSRQYIHHGRTLSIQTQHLSQAKTLSSSSQGRRGSLPPLQIGMANKSVEFGSPILRSPFATSIPPLPEKVSIQIAHPKSDFTHVHILRQNNILENILYIALWYFFSTSLSLYNKNLMGKDRFNFNFPLLLSAIHAGLHAVITWMMMSLGGGRWNPSKSGSSISTSGGTTSMSDYLHKVVPCGIAAALEICCANASLMFVTLSFYTMVKSSTPLWVLLFSFIFGFEKPRVRLVAIIGLMVVGVILTVEGETKFDMAGFLLVLVAAIVSGLRWNLTQLLLQQDQLGMDNPIATLYHLSPIMFVTMLMLSLILENPIDQFRQSKHFDNFFHVLESFGLMAIGGLLAFAMTLAELYLIKNTNTITLSVAGISKEIVIIALSVLIYGDILTPKTLLGLFVSILGIIAYNCYKFSKQQHAENSQYQMIPLHFARKIED